MIKEEHMSNKYKSENDNSSKSDYKEKNIHPNYMDWNNMIQRTITRSVNTLQKQYPPS